MSTAGRFPFGAGVADFATKQTGAYLSVAAGAVITMWTAQTGGTQITDLLAADGVTAITSVTTLADGTLPLFYGPATGLTVMWANGGGAELARIQSDPSAAYAPLYGRVAAARRLLQSFNDVAYTPFTLTTDAPTVTVSTTATITARVVGAQTGEVTVIGSRINGNGSWNSASGRLSASQVSGIDVIHNGTAIEFRIFAGFTGTLPCWVFVDGQPMTTAPDTTSIGSVTASTEYYVKLTFGAARRRRIEFISPHSGAWYGVAVGLQDTLEPAPRRPVVGWVGDSFFGGSTPSPILQCAPIVASRQLGVECYSVSFGGTGWVAPGAFTTFGDPTRVSAMAAANPDLIVFQGSVNDDTLTGIQAATTAALAAYRTALPNTPFIVLGPQPSNATDTLSTNRSNNIAAVKAAALLEPSVIAFHDEVGTAGGVPAAYAATTYADGSLFTGRGSVWQLVNGGSSLAVGGGTVPTTAAQFQLRTWCYYGTGRVGATAGDGNRDTMVENAGIHPEPAASQAFADLIATRIRSDLLTFAQTGAVTVE